MSIIGKILGRFGYTKGIGPSLFGTSINNIDGSPRPTVHNMGQYLGRYADQAWVYSCIRIIQTKAASVPLKIYKIVDGKKKEQPDHRLKRLIDKANPFMEGYDLFEGTYGFEELTGNAYWLLDSFFGGLPTEIFLMNPSRVRIVADKDKYITGYTYEVQPGVNKLTMDISEVLHFKKWNPLDDFYGLAPLSAGRDASDTMMFADRFNKNFFLNSAEPGGILTTEGSLEQEQAERIGIAWKKMHGGVRKSSRIAVMEGGIKYQPVASSHKDMRFPELKKMTREDVLTVYGVPPVMVGVFDEADYANAKEQRRIFWLDTIVPRLKKSASVINERLIRPYDPSVVAAYDLSEVEEIQEDAELQAKTDATLTEAGIVTINEVRKRRNFVSVSWGDTWNAPFNLTPIDGDRETEAGGEKIEDGRREAKKDGKGSKLGGSQEETSTIEKEEDAGKKRRDLHWIEFKGFTEAHERRWMPELRRLFNAQEREVIANLRDSETERSLNQIKLDGMKTFHQKIEEFLFDKSESLKAWRKAGEKLISFTLLDKAKEEITKFSLNIDFNLKNPLVSEWIKEKAFIFSQEINQKTDKDLRKALQEGINAGESIGEIEKRIEDVFDIARGVRTRRIARTEVISASNKGAFEAYVQSGIISEIEWVSSRDAKVRPEHQIDGQKTKIGVPFSNGLKHPGDPSGSAGNVINCRCTTAAVVEENNG